jgi:alpha/beta superfamily hydrolase
VSETENLRLQTDDGLSLEAAIDQPDQIKAALVFCHPHPKMGGTMNAPLLLAIRDALLPLGWAVLRFNFRGIGDSEGDAGIGIDELKDAKAAVAEAHSRWPGTPIAIAGWSFGAAVAVKTAADSPGLVACVAIAPAVKEKPGITAGLPPASEVALDLPTLFLVGANDDLTLPEDAKAWSSAAGVTFSEMPGANHFFWAKYDKLAVEVVSFLEDVVG